MSWRWMRVADLRSAMRWPFDHTSGGKYGAQNSNGWVRLQGVWVHQTDLPTSHRLHRAGRL